MGLQPLQIFYCYSAVSTLTSETEVYRRQYLTSKIGPGAEGVKSRRDR